MKFRFSILFGLILLLSFALGIVSQHLPTRAKAKVQKVEYKRNTTNAHIVISITPTQPPKKAQVIDKPLGFCLSVPVLLYHHIQPESEARAKGQTSLTVDSGIFDQQMAYLAAKGYTSISAKQLVEAILSHSSVPPKSVVITFDDGYLDNYLYAYPILQKYRLQGNLMVATGLLGNSSGTNSYYSWDQLKQMVDSGAFSAYDHTWSHYAMGIGPVDKALFEAKTGLEQLRQHLGAVYPIFVYPYGSGQKIPWVWQLLKNNGFTAAFSTLPGTLQCESTLMYLPRLHIGNASLASYGL